MDFLSVVQAMWPCVQDKWPELSGAVLQVVGGATVLYRLFSNGKTGMSEGTPYIGKLISMLGTLGLNKK
jgi:hypothetical protein